MQYVLNLRKHQNCRAEVPGELVKTQIAGPPASNIFYSFKS